MKCATLSGGNTPFGRYLYAVGGNPEAARLAGVPVAAFDPEGLARVLSLPEDEEPVYLVPIGKPA